MKPKAPIQPKWRGSTLVEAVIALSVLAIAVPLVFGAMAESGKTQVSSWAETRSTWIIPACLREIQVSRQGLSQYFPATGTGETFPPSGEVWALAFAADGTPVGRISKALYDHGCKELDGKSVRYIAAMSATAPESPVGQNPMLLLRITFEFPASAIAEKRQRLDFHTRIP